jgi:hypothetical protein
MSCEPPLLEMHRSRKQSQDRKSPFDPVGVLVKAARQEGILTQFRE